MATKKIMVVPCSVNSWLYCSGERKVDSGLAKLNANQQHFKAADQQEHERRGDIHQTDLFMIGGDDPFVHHL